MGRWLNGILLWSWLALLAACIQIAPRSSVPFHAPLDRQARYAAEVTLAIKEERRDEFSEAAANGRLVLPQMPEIWGVDGGRPVPDVAPAASQVALLAPPPPNPRRQRTQAPAAGELRRPVARLRAAVPRAAAGADAAAAGGRHARRRARAGRRSRGRLRPIASTSTSV